MKVYIVTGSTGSYEDYRHWNVIGYVEEEKAMLHVAHAQKFMIDNGRVYGKSCWEPFNKINPYDPFMIVDHNGVFYDYFEIEVLEQFIDRSA